MPTFKFKAKNLKGEETEGTREAEDRFALARILRQDNFILIDFKEEGKKKKFDLKSISIGGVSANDKIIFTHNLAVMIEAGLPISKSLKILIKQTRNPKFKKALLQISTNIIKGDSLSSSMAKYPKIFSNLYVSMIKAGEKTGKLQETLDLIADQMEKEAHLKKKVKSAMVYPAIIVTAMIGVAILMLIYVVPSLTSTFEELGVELPISTQIIVWLSNSLVTNSLLILGVVLIFIMLFVYLFRKPNFRNKFDGILLRTPIVAPLVQKINSARTARTLSSLIDSGVSILEAIDTTKNVVQNTKYKQVLKEAKKEIQKGEPIASTFKKSDKIFPILFGEMTAVGEETGKLSEMLLQLAEYYEEEVDEITKNMATIIEPVLMIIIGVAVGFFAISMIKPMYSMLGAI